MYFFLKIGSECTFLLPDEKVFAFLFSSCYHLIMFLHIGTYIMMSCCMSCISHKPSYFSCLSFACHGVYLLCIYIFYILCIPLYGKKVFFVSFCFALFHMPLGFAWIVIPKTYELIFFNVCILYYLNLLRIMPVLPSQSNIDLLHCIICTL